MPYPPTRRDDLVEVLHGHEVADPYRWLEDAEAPEVAAWVAAQREHAERALEELPGRAWFTDLMRRIVARPRAGVPLVRGGRVFLSRNDGTSPHDVWYMADTLEELERGGRLVLDPNDWSADGTASLSTFSVSPDGRLLAYAVSHAGSDWQHLRVRDLETLSDLDRPDVVAKFSSPVWLPDGRSFLYTTFDQFPGDREAHRGRPPQAALGGARLMVHRLDGEDELLVSFPDEPDTLAFGQRTHDGRWLVVTIVVGTESVNRLWAYPIRDAGGRSTLGDPIRVVDERAAEFTFVRVDGEVLYLHTDLDAPLGRVVAVDLAWAARGDVEFAEVVPEAAATLSAVEAAGDALLLAYLDDAQPVVQVVGLDGEHRGELPLPPGALIGLDGSPDRSDAFVGVSTLDAPTAAYRFGVADDAAGDPALEALELTSRTERFAPGFTVGRHRAVSPDGTRVPYFLVVPEGGDPGPRPVLLYGYGGFKIPVLADYRPGWSAWLRAGGALAIANLRGGGEFGTAWYEQGRLHRKQNVFDDLVAVAEHLVATGATTPGQLAVHGRSNGGLLVGAALTQRPDLFAVALPTVGVLDLLRFHRFTIGAAWKSDYGDPDTPEGFEAAYAYSPLHRLRPGVRYPATLVSTADHDDRVVPLHSFKFAAALQHAQSGDAPVLLRVEVSAGHGAGKTLDAVATEWADLLAFAAHHTGLEVPEG